jgi:D-beta-D-heptose 7-phosphate kinase/D-beta-D-heptose 1-phosphate adenosyltransferase
LTKAHHESLRHLVPRLDKFSETRVVVVGDIMQDIFIWGKVKRISPEAPVPVVEVQRQTAMLGGAANVVHNLRALGAQAGLAGVVGDDEAGRAVLAELDRAGVDRCGVVIEPGRPTSVKTRIIAHHQQVVRFDREEQKPIASASRLALAKELVQELSGAQALIISDYAKGVISRELMEQILAAAGDRPVVVDPKVKNLDCFRGATVITPNATEAGEAVGQELADAAALERAGWELLRRLEARAVMITRGEEGISLFEKGLPKSRHIPAEAREVFDVTGAGDTVIATFTLALAAGMSFFDATRTANLAAGIVVGKLGTSTVTQDELREALENGGLV